MDKEEVIKLLDNVCLFGVFSSILSIPIIVIAHLWFDLTGLHELVYSAILLAFFFAGMLF